jgi:hypothetical protein
MLKTTSNKTSDTMQGSWLPLSKIILPSGVDNIISSDIRVKMVKMNRLRRRSAFCLDA